MDFTFYPEKDPYESKKTVSAFNNNYIQYESIGDKDKNLSIKEYIDIIRPYLSDIINNRIIIKLRENGKLIQEI